jgi:hypothetical protein
MTYESGRADSDSVNLGSNPSSPANDFNKLRVPVRVYWGPGYHVGITGTELGGPIFNPLVGA